ncbi:MAG: hypothetical protein O7A09_12655, partial [Proteobacteria bacterium]|nr:hypothetical protein [Pseudomonadota bacterium]
MDASGARRGNRALAVGLLDALGAAGLGEARARALAAAGGDETALRTGRDELPAATVMAAFAAASPERTLCRSVGRSVLGPERQGLALLTGGVGGPEKAYRRIDQLLPKEDPTGAYRAAEIAAGGARVVYAPGEHGVTAAFCGVREGMLAAIPQLFGLPAGQVRESLCA